MSKLSSLINTVSEKTSALIWKANLLKSEPKDIHELRDHMTMKLRNKYERGYFVFSMTAKDDQPILLISSEDRAQDGIHSPFFVLAFGKGPKDGIPKPFIHGAYECVADIFRFQTSDEMKSNHAKTKENYVKGFAEYITKKANHADVAEAFWASFGPISETLPKAIFLNGINLVPAKMIKGRWVAASFNLVRCLLADTSRNRLPGEVNDLGKDGRLFTTPQGIRISEESEVQLELLGAIAATAESRQLMANILPAELGDIFAEHFEQLKAELIKIEAGLVANKLTRDKAQTQCEQALETFSTQFQQAGLQSVHEKWIAHTRSEYTHRRYSLKAGFGIAVSAFGVVSGVATAVGTGVTGVGGAIGVAITIRKSLNLAAEVYTFFREIETVRKVLEKQLTVKAVKYLQANSNEDWKDVGRSFLGVFKLTKPLNALEDLVGGEGNVKSPKALKANLTEFSAKIASTNAHDEKLLKEVQQVMEQADELEEQLLSVADKSEKKKRQQYIDTLRAGVTTQLNQLSVLGRQLNDYLLILPKFEQLMQIIEDNQWHSKSAKAVNDLLMPILSMTIKLRPGELLDNLIQVGTCTVKEGINGYALYEYCTDPKNAPKEAAQLNKLLDEVANITQSLEAMRKKSSPKAGSVS